MNKKNSNKNALLWIYNRGKKFIPAVLLLAVISILSSLGYVALALISKNVLDIATGAVAGNMLLNGILLCSIVVGIILLSGLNSYLNTRANGKLAISIRNYIFAKVSHRKYSEISEYHSGDLLNRLTSDTDVIVSAITGIIPRVSGMVAKIIGGISALIVLDARIALIILCLGVAVPAIGRVVNERYKNLHKQVQKSEGNTRSFLQECFENIVVLKTFESEIPFFNKLNLYLKDNYKLKIKRNNISIVTHLGLYSFFTIGYYAVLLWGADGIAKGVMTYGTLNAFLQLVQQLRAPMQNVSGILPQYYSALASAERLMELEEGFEDKPSVAKEKLNEIIDSFSSIELSGIDFAYKDELILKGCTFSVPKGKITALTGESGSGKSTVFKLILGLYEAQAGEISVNGNIPLDTSLRGLFAYVPQGNMVLSGSIKDNITLNNDDIDEQKLIDACKAAEIYDLILSTPSGFDTELSERGAGLSEGQIQRISIARALLTDAPVLLLDEATSALDEETETKVLSNIKAMSDKTVLFVTHRNTSLKVCDRIVHVENKVFSVIKE